jgi:CRP-like cAMP-binding protein
MANGVSTYHKRVEELFKNARAKKYPKNQIIRYQGDALTEIYLIKKGYVKAYTILDSGDTRTMFLLGPGDIFPIAFSLTMDWENYSVRYFYQSLTDVEVLAQDAGDLKRQIDTKPEMTTIYLAYMAASNEAIMRQLEAMKNKSATEKVVVLLPYLVDKLGKQTKPGVYKLEIKVSHQEIADLSGVTRETATTLIKKLEARGIIKQQRSTWIVHTNNLPASL